MEVNAEGKLDLGNPFWFVSVALGIMGILLLIYGIYIVKHKPILQKENIIMSSPSKKGVIGLFFSFRRPPLKEKRPEFWMIVLMTGIGGATMIGIAVWSFNFLSASVPSEATFNLVITVSGISFGILMITLSAWLATSELYAVWESRKQLIANRKTAYLNLMKDFDKSFRDLKRTTQPKTRETMLAEFQDNFAIFVTTVGMMK